MKCKFTEQKNLTVMLIVGIIMIVAGAVTAWILPEEAHMAVRLAGFVNGVGTSMTVIAGVMLLRRVWLGEARARDSELAMNDERGLAVAYKAQNVAAIAAVFSLIAMTLAGLLRGETFYAFFGSMLLCAVALIKLAAWYIYNKRM